MLKSIDVPKLETWKANFSDSKNNAQETESAVISLELLQRFIDEAKINSPGFNGVRIYFIRYTHPDDQLRPFNGYVREIGDSLSQVSLAFVPVKHFDPVTLLTGIDFVQDGGQIHTLAVCHPSDWPAVIMENGAMQTGQKQTRTYGMQMETQTATMPLETMEMETTEKGTGLCPPKCVPPRP
jgi:hypothetical protein